jgi:hypothetical protein
MLTVHSQQVTLRESSLVGNSTSGDAVCAYIQQLTLKEPLIVGNSTSGNAVWKISSPPTGDDEQRKHLLAAFPTSGIGTSTQHRSLRWCWIVRNSTLRLCGKLSITPSGDAEYSAFFPQEAGGSASHLKGCWILSSSLQDILDTQHLFRRGVVIISNSHYILSFSHSGDAE